MHTDRTQPHIFCPDYGLLPGIPLPKKTKWFCDMSFRAAPHGSRSPVSIIKTHCYLFLTWFGVEIHTMVWIRGVNTSKQHKNRFRITFPGLPSQNITMLSCSTSLARCMNRWLWEFPSKIRLGLSKLASRVFSLLTPGSSGEMNYLACGALPMLNRDGCAISRSIK